VTSGNSPRRRPRLGKGLRDPGADIPAAAGNERDASRKILHCWLPFAFVRAFSSSLKIRSGVMVELKTLMSSADSASETAFAIAAGAPIVPPSPIPRKPPGDCRTAFDMDDVDMGNLDRGGYDVVGKARAHELTVFVIDHLFVKCGTNTLRDTAVNLPVDDHRIDDATAILRHDISEYFYKKQVVGSTSTATRWLAHAVVPLMGS